MTPIASLLQRECAKAPASFFDAHTFVELVVGQKFVCSPLPTENGAGAGFKTPLIVYTKIAHQVHELRGVPYTTPHGRGTTSLRANFCDFPHHTPVFIVH